jgi:hypothetical protein
MAARISAANKAPAIHHMCQISAKPSSVASMAITKPAAVLDGMWMGWKLSSGRLKPRCFMSYQASCSCTTGVNAKL